MDIFEAFMRTSGTIFFTIVAVTVHYVAKTLGYGTVAEY
jgi:hypothetical protein